MPEHPLALAGVPALAMSMLPPEEAARRGTVLLLHGLTGSKEVQRNEARSLSEHGYLAVTLDAVGHGGRRYPDFDRRFPRTDLEVADRSFFEVVRQSAEEIPAVLEALRERGWALPGRLGGCGISMGGAILFGALASGCRFDAAAPIVASPVWRHAPFSPHQRVDRFFPTPLLVQTAGEDEVVAPGESRALCEALVPRYASAPERLRYVEHPGERHLFSPAGWDRAWGAVLEWLDRFLR